MKKLLSIVLCSILILNCLLACVSCDMGELLEEPEETKANKTENTQKNEQTVDIETEINTEGNTDKPTNIETQTLAESNTGAVEQPTDTAASSEYTTEYVFEDVSVCPHEYGDYEAVNEASCTQNGLSQRVCGICGKSQQKEIIANGHEFSSWDIIRSIGGDTYECTRFCYECGVTEQKVISFADGGTATGFSGGDGTEGNPYIISSAAELYWLAYTVNSFVYEGYNNAHYILTTDIYLGGYQWEPIGVYYFDDGSNIDTDKDMTFSGTFDGNGHTIYGLTITECEDYHEFFGLFGSLEEGAVIKNLNMEYFNISIDSDKEIYIGGLAGCAKEARIENCHVDGSITVNSGREDAFVGGLVGKNSYTPINSCSANVNVDASASYSTGGDLHVGGLIGEVTKSDITNSYSSGSIYARAEYTVYIGGFIGEIRSGYANIETCYSNCNIGFEGEYDGSTQYIGGFVGQIYISDDFNIANCYAMGSVVASAPTLSLGGFIGETSGESITISFSYSTGDVICDTEEYSNVGGFIGNLGSANVNDCYAEGNVTVNSHGDGIIYVGGFAGESGSDASILNCYAMGDVLAKSENSASACGGLIGDVGGSNIEYCYAIGDVIATNAYAGGLVGEFKGNITNCYATGNILCMGEKESVYVYSGGLVGRVTSANISCSYATGNVCAIAKVYNLDAEAGGLIADCGGANIFIENCYALGNVCAEANGETGNAISGGLIGVFSSTGTVNNCYAAGDVTAITHNIGYASAWAGGLIGESKGTVKNCITYGNQRAICDDTEGEAVSDKLIAYVNKNSSVLENNYTYDNSRAYENGELADENQSATSVSKDKLNDKSFYINGLGFDPQIWNFAELDIDNNKLPIFN